jgi:hypothetical protein
MAGRNGAAGAEQADRNDAGGGERDKFAAGGCFTLQAHDAILTCYEFNPRT